MRIEWMANGRENLPVRIGKKERSSDWSFSALPYLMELLSVKESGIERIQMSPEARKGANYSLFLPLCSVPLPDLEV